MHMIAVSAAMAAGTSDTLWSVTDMAEMIDATPPKPERRGPHKEAGRMSLRADLYRKRTAEFERRALLSNTITYGETFAMQLSNGG